MEAEAAEQQQQLDALDAELGAVEKHKVPPLKKDVALVGVEMGRRRSFVNGARKTKLWRR